MSAQSIVATSHISSANGLSNDFVISMAIDGRGHVWVATEAGVNIIAGKTCRPVEAEQLQGRITALHSNRMTDRMIIGTELGMTVYDAADGSLHRLDADSGGLVRSSINDIADAADGGLWLVYGNGSVQHFDTRTLTVTNLKQQQTHNSRCALDDGQGRLYIGHSQHGMSVVDRSSGETKTFRHRKGDAQSLPGNNVRCIYKAPDGNIWVGTDTGLALFHPETGTFTRVTHQGDSYDDNVYDIHLMADGRLWVATDIGGVKILEQSAMKTDGTQPMHYADTPTELSSRNTRSIVEDDYGNVWVGNHSTGVDFISGSKQDFELLDYKDTSGRYPTVWSMATDPEQGFWMAGESELVWWQNGAVKERWSTLNGMRREYASPRSLMADSHGRVWMGVDDQGVYCFNKQTKQFTAVPISPEGSDIHCFDEDSEGRIWIGGEFGIYCYQNGKAVIQHGISRIVKAPATCIIETEPNQLFIATLGDGIYSYNLQNGAIRHMNINDGLSSSKINHAVRTAHGGIWLATDNGLVYVDDPVNLAGISCYGKEQGLADRHILALQQEQPHDGNQGQDGADERIWMSTYSGISCFVKNMEKFYNFNHQDIRISGGFANGGAITDDKGTVYFASAGGVCHFQPWRIGSSEQIAEVQILSCEAYNPVGSNTEIQLLTPDNKGQVTTTYQHNTIRLTFAMRNYAQTEAVDYSYMMKGMDNKWYDIGNDHDVVFRGLRYGHYTFILRAKLRSQDWDQCKQTQIHIVITPPFWRTWWAYILYAVAAMALATWLIRSYARRLTLRSELELERRKSQQTQEMNEERLRFFTNITHELRTPLTLILGPLDDLMDDEQLSPARRRLVGVIQKSAERLRDLINELLEFRKTETHNRHLTVAHGDIGAFVREIHRDLKELNRNDDISLRCNIAEGLPLVWFDSEVLTTIVTNFMSNAIKYTEKGSITTSVKATTDGYIRIEVADTGHGIAADALPHVFERYYQAKGSHQASGTGIGLALVKSLAELHEGKVCVSSTEGKGSVFSLLLEIANNYPNALHKDEVTLTTTDTDNQQPHYAEEVTEDDNEQSTPQLLIVEDNSDIRQYIADTLGDDYTILQAENGKEGLEMARTHIPDIIISDIMMPHMNGIDMTRQIKDDINTSHIPIILLTAKNTDDDKEMGYNSGADSYLTKPFTAKLIASRIRNLINARRRLSYLVANGQQQSTKQPDTATTERQGTTAATAPDNTPRLSPLDQAFIDRLNQLIEDNIMQNDIDMAFVTDKMAMSHSTFYRKVKALTGLTATEYIRKLRLRHCYRLLTSGDYNVNQAAMMTGFNQMAHFREMFKREFGILPSEVRKL